MISFDRLSIKTSFAESPEFDESVDSDYSSSEADHVFREGRRGCVEEMLLVLKRANPVSDDRDDPDIDGSPASKRKRRTYRYGIHGNDGGDTCESDEREGVEERSYSSEDYGYDQNDEEEVLPHSTAEASRKSLQMSTILGILQQASIDD